MREIIVLSGKGGAGKTSLTAAFAALAKNTVVCDLDVDAPDLHILLDPKDTVREDFFSGNEAVIDQDACAGCGMCRDLCHFDAVEEKNGVFRIDGKRCEGCKLCVTMGAGRLALPLPGFSPETDVRELAPGLTFVTGIVRRPGAFEATAGLYRDTSGTITDPVPDDACLVIEGDDGIVLLLGCCHSGLGNTLAHLRARLGITAVEAVIGGLHLAHAPETAVAETLAALKAFGVRRLLPGHCTGQPAVDRLARDFPGQTVQTGAGMRMRV